MPETDSNRNYQHPATRRNKSIKNLTGQYVNHWHVYGFLYTLINTRRAVWLCRCDCGEFSRVTIADLLSGHSKSCGHVQRKVFSKISTTHGLTNTRIYRIFKEIHRRCYGQNRPSYPDYGGRGIRVCQGWHEIANFVRDVGHPPTKLHTIDRRDNNGNYSCGHCDECVYNGWPLNARWATRKEQNRNRRDNRLIVHDGQTKTMAEWAEITGIKQPQIWKRLDRGWPTEEALGFKEHLSRQGQRPARTGYKSKYEPTLQL